MIAVIALLGDPASLYRGVGASPVRIDEKSVRRLGMPLSTFSFTFSLAVIGLACRKLFSSTSSLPNIFRSTSHVAVSAGATAFFCSLVIPSAIIRAQSCSKLDEEVGKRRQNKKGGSASTTGTEVDAQAKSSVAQPKR